MSRDFNENAGVMSSEDSEIPAANEGIRAPARVASRLQSVIFTVLLLAGIGALGWFSFSLAGLRIYQVDECLNVFVAHTIATHQSGPGMDLFQLLLSWLLPMGARAAELFASARLVTWLIFWLNFILIALATGERIFSRRWLFALAGAASLAPMWDYGFEIRHDILLLAGVLLIWGVVRFQPPRLGTFFFVGACAVVLVFVSVKSILFTFPICLGVFLSPPPGQRPARWKLALAGGIGAAVAFVIVQFVFKTAGLDENHLLANVKGIATVPAESFRFLPFSHTLPRLLTQTPLLGALAIAAIMTCAAAVMREKRAALNWDGFLPEVLLLGVALVALFINPNPYPYNLLHVAPYAFLLAYRYGAILWKQYPQQAVFAPVALSMIAFTHLAPFMVATQRHWSYLNDNQERLMTIAEDLTDPDKDSVFDGVGMVPTRKMDCRLLIHGQEFLSLLKNSATGVKMRDLLEADPSAVVIRNYRTEWMSNEDQKFLRQRYVPIADDLMVLGTQMHEGGGRFEIYHAGRYRITSAEGSNIVGTYAEPKTMKEDFAPPKEEPPLVGTIDGKPLDGKPVELSVGTHQLECSVDQKAAVAWVGPHLDKLPRLMGRDRHELFSNWY
jgi:hypothetical protein